jgi:hypothetical protein
MNAAEFEIHSGRFWLTPGLREQKYLASSMRFLVLGWTMGTPAEYRKHARECVELAEKAVAEHHRTMLLAIAVKWLQLASQAQREDDLLAAENIKRAG